MRRFFIILLTVMALLLTACGTSEQGTNPPEEKKAYTYPGEERQMAYRNPAFDNAATAEGAAYSPSFTDPSLQNRFSYTGIIHWVDSHNNHVFTVLCLPDGYDGSQKYPLVLMLHGFNSTLDEWNYYVRGLNDAGYACLLFDFRGGHSGSSSRSDGKMTQMSFDTKLADIRAVAEYAKGLEMIDQQNLLLAGHSQGGMMALITMCDEQLSQSFRGVLLLAPYTDATIVSKYSYPEEVPDSASLLLCTVGRDYLYSAWKYDHLIWDVLPSYSNPVLLLTGESDEIVKVSSVEKVAKTIGDNASFHVIAGGYHDFQPELMDSVMNDFILPFFGKLVSPD